MIQFFKDRHLTRRADEKSPQWLIVSQSGGVKEAVLWLGNESFGKLTAPLSPGADSMILTNADTFPAFGWVRIGDQHIHFTVNDGIRLTGIPTSGSGSISRYIPASLAVRSANREYTDGNLVISADQLADGKFRMRNLSRRWRRNGSTLERIPSSFTLPGSDLVTTLVELNGDKDLLLYYDFTGSGSADVQDLTVNQMGGLAQGGEIVRVPAFPFATVAGSFASGAHLKVQNLGAVFPAAGSVEMWVRGVTPLCTLFSVVDPITSAEKFAIKLNPDKTIRVVQELASGLLKTYNGFVPADEHPDWNQVVVTWDQTSLSVYVNGSLETTYQLQEPIAVAGDCYFGKGSQEPFTGGFCKIRVWKSTLGADRIATSWNGGDSWMPNENEPVLGIQVEASCSAGAEVVEQFSLRTQEIVQYDQDPAAAVAAMRFMRRNNGLRGQMRMLPASRKVSAALPAFRWGEYRWRENEENSREVFGTNWDADHSGLEEDLFQSGIGQGADLELVGIKKIASENSIVPVIRGGEYFIGKERNYLPGKAVLEIIDTTIEDPFTLSATPRLTKPIFVGRWRSNHVDRYVKDIDCRYVGDRYSAEDEFDPEDSGFQFRLNRKTRQLWLNHAVDPESGFIGVFPSTELRFTFRLPVHPIKSVESIYISGGRAPKSWEFDQIRGTVTVEIDPADQSLWAKKLVYADYTPAFGVLYEMAGADEAFTADVELNPAFAGVANGFVYLQHKIWQPKDIQLQVDKPRIPYVPAATSEDIQFGPVMPNDFAVLTATAFGNSVSELITGARLKVVVDNQKFVGAVNYQDPTKTDVWVTTGADGSASLVYTPGNTFGQYIALASINIDTITLPEAIPLEQLYDKNTEEFIVHTYAVMNDDPYLGKVGAETDAGEVAWTEAGVAGSTSYKTNGRRLEWKTPGGEPVFPSDLKDAAGKSFTDPAFSGQVKYIIYSDTVLMDARIGAYFVAFAGKVTLRLYSPIFNVLSNPITLRVVPPEQITEVSFLDDSVWAPIAGYLSMNDFSQLSGKLNVNRLTGGPLLQLQFSKRV
jgi:hypothetical protein